MHFFDESSVIKTTGNKNYGHAPVGQSAVEIQRYASNATYTVNLLHGIRTHDLCDAGAVLAEVMGSNPVESPEFFRFMRQLLKLSSKCEDHIFS